ncbi:MAG: hypothetical protein QM621_03560 [Aeromicrobium sp.]|uniref:hypothetical protein n=1 Tax=Aeromicrobium sp. TaxID=1871063 RepID=UPI0039E40CD9
MSPRRVAAVAALLLAAVGCGGGGPSGPDEYCEAVEKNRSGLDAATTTSDSFEAMAASLRAIEKQAPAGIRSDYAEVAESVEALLAAQEASGVPMESFVYDDVGPMEQADVDALRAAYQDFLDTAEVRTTIADHIASECEVTLKAPGEAAQ